MVRIFLVALATLFIAVPAQAHPHVWVTMHTELVYGLTGASPAFVTPGRSMTCSRRLPPKGSKAKRRAKFTREELAPLAKVNVESLKEFDYFTYATRDGEKGRADRSHFEYWLDYKDQVLTLNFMLPFKTPIKAKELKIEIYDPTFSSIFLSSSKTRQSLSARRNANSTCSCRAK